MNFLDALKTTKNDSHKAVRAVNWKTDPTMRGYVLLWSQAGHSHGAWMIQNVEDPDAIHLALLPKLADLEGDWESVDRPR